jgi:peptidoglycan/LPS O-acetylase OafA/YrhL
MLVHLLTANNSLIERALSLPPLVGVGTVSYGLYLWHYPIWTVFWPAVAWLHIPAALHQAIDLIVLLPLSLAVCTLSHRYVERPFLALRDRDAPKTAEQPAATVAPLEV